MNRLIIVGNGFDLAHGLPTGYCDFIDWYWRDVLKAIPNLQTKEYNDDLISIQLLFKQQSLRKANRDFEKVKDYAQLKLFVESYSEAYQEKWAEQFDRCYIKFYNSFLETISNKQHIQNWVDIENEYYKLLKDCLKEDDNSKVKKLNEEFEQVKQLLETYLNEVSSKINFKSLNDKAGELLEHFVIKRKKITRSEFIEHFPNKRNSKMAQEYPTHLDEDSLAQDVQVKNLFLDFNYTFSLDLYSEYMNLHEDEYDFGSTNLIQIHGRLNDADNKINFGFGDEMDNHYQKIEEKDDNEYLKYIKSFQYSQNSNYKKVLDFIESEKFQVYIMGHSCGLSDRILLNTIFEHEHCRSIKVFYYKNGDWDNYTEIVQNISRHFNKKKMMRDKIVNKSLCQPLPQDIRFEARTQPS